MLPATPCFRLRLRSVRLTDPGGPSLAPTADGTDLAATSSVGAATYQPRAAEGTILHRLVRDHLETFSR